LFDTLQEVDEGAIIDQTNQTMINNQSPIRSPQVTDWLGAPPVLSKFAMLTKTRADGTAKRRVILDCSASGVSDATVQNQRVVLPRALEVARDIVHAANRREDGDEVELLVLDFKDAFYHVPCLHDERRWLHSNDRLVMPPPPRPPIPRPGCG
jgi:hypothetical protein